MRTPHRSVMPLAIAVLGCLLGRPLRAQDARNEQFYLPGAFNWAMLKNYPEAGRLFNAFDYGHAILYEKLYTEPQAPVENLETSQFEYLTTDLLIRPPRFAVAEEVIEPNYAKLAWKAKLMFDWAHILHRQVYDVYADPRLSQPTQDSLVEVLTDYYLSNRRLAFSAVPKSMQLMDGQEFSQVFRRRCPKMNGLIWAYHWLQVGLYEPLIAGQTPAEKKAGVKAVLARFWSMVEDPPHRFPKVMPMTAAVAPEFSRRHPRAAVIFDNLHMMHDIISDVLASPNVPRDRKRAVIYEQLAESQRGDQNTMSMEDWRNMGNLMGGVGIMGGPALGLLPDPPTAGASAPDMAGMAGMKHGGEGQDMKGMPMPGSSTSEPMRMMMEMHARMMADPVIRERMMADTTMQRMMREMMGGMTTEQMDGMMMSEPAVADSTAAGHGHHPSTPPAKPKGRNAPGKKARPSPQDSLPAKDHTSMPGMKMPADSVHH